MRALTPLYRFFLRFRYPVAMPEDVAHALGIELSNHITFEEFMSHLINPVKCRPTRLVKFMPREQAEAAFQGACRKERFKQNTLCSYYFCEGWVEFVLLFDEHSRLRRIYVQHQFISRDEGIEIQLSKEQIPF